MSDNRLFLPGMLVDGTDPINRGLAAWLPMNEGAGSRVYDITGSRNNGILSGGPTWSGSFGAPAMLFDGVDDNIVLPTNCFDAHTTGAVSMWAYLNSVGGGTVFAQCNSASNEQLTQFNFGTLTRFFVRTTGNVVIINADTGAFVPVAGKWYHLIYQMGAGARIYVNGVNMPLTFTTGTSSTVSWFSDLASVTDNYGIGQTNRLTVISPFPGLIRDVRVHSRALLDAEAARFYRQQFLGFVERRRYLYVAAAGGSALAPYYTRFLAGNANV